MPSEPIAPITCVKAYDVRGHVGTELTGTIAACLARAFADLHQARRIVLGQDARASSPLLATTVAETLIAAGMEVHDLGLCGTEEVYHATDHFSADGGIMITASHNPAGDNGMKFVRAGAAPLAPGALSAIRALAESGDFAPARGTGRLIPATDARDAYARRVLSFTDPALLRPLHILVNAGNGAAGPAFDAIAQRLQSAGAPLTFTRLHHTPDSTFPNGIPNPQLPENHPATGQAVLAASAGFGVAWDGDFDRCFLFDHLGRFVPGEYVTGLLAQAFLAREPGAAIVHDPRVIWNTQDAIAAAGGRAIQSRTGHAFMKQAMRDSGAAYGGEMSAHHYFRDFMACDSGMIPWLLIAGLISQTGTSLADLVETRRAAFPSSGEINFPIADAGAAMARVREALGPQAIAADETDGLSLTFPGWRLNLRNSNTESLIRLNVETRAEPALLTDRVRVVSALILGQAV